VERQLAASRRSSSPARRAASNARSAASPWGSFLLQGGDCAESFSEESANNVSANNIRDFLRVILQMAVVLTYAARCGGEGWPHRGQFAKRAPRRPKNETARNCRATAATSSMGRVHCRCAARDPHGRSRPTAFGATLNLLRAFVHGGYANLAMSPVDARICEDSSQSHHYEELADRISEALGFMQACGLDLESHPELKSTISIPAMKPCCSLRAGDDARGFNAPRHVLLHLAHMLWIGDRRGSRIMRMSSSAAAS